MNVRGEQKALSPMSMNSDVTLFCLLREAIMKSNQNKKSLINFICDMEHSHQSLSLIGEGSPYTHEEADVTIISYLLKLHQSKGHIQVLADDTDIFVMLLYFCWIHKPSAHVTMKKYDGKIIDIKATAEKLGEKCLDLLATHALSGCDSVSYPFGKGKVTAINLVLNSKVTLREFANPLAPEEVWIKEGLCFISSLYGGTGSTSLANLRYSIFSKKKEPPKVKSLPPTDDAAVQHIRRARLQVLIWRAADQMAPPDTDITQYGWKIENNMLTPVAGTSAIAPPSVLQSIACSCKSSHPCSSQRCSCHVSALSCTSYCKCGADDSCANKHTKSMKPCSQFEDHNDADDDDYDDDEANYNY